VSARLRACSNPLSSSSDIANERIARRVAARIASHAEANLEGLERFAAAEIYLALKAITVVRGRS
jgi:hypothetical protein